MAGYQARRTVPYRALTAYWKSHGRWLVDPPATGVEPGSVGMFSLQRRWEPLKGVNAKKLGIDVTPDGPVEVKTSAWYSQETMEAKAGGGASHASVTLRLLKHSRRNGGAVLAIPGGQHTRLLYPERIGEELKRLVSAKPPKWDPRWCLVQEVWTPSKLPGGRVLVGSANMSVSIEAAAGMSGIAGGTLSGGRIAQVLGGAQEEIPAECAAMLTCWRVDDQWINRRGKKRVKRPDGSTYYTAGIEYAASPDQLRQASPAELLTEVTVAVLNADLDAVITEENAALAAIGITTATVVGALARTVMRRTGSRAQQRDYVHEK